MGELPLVDAPLAPPPADVDDAPLVSCICPTTPSRAWAFETAYASFCRQTYARTELLVFETGGDPSPFWRDVAARDARVRYAHARDDAPLGAKRNRLVRDARGEVVAHVDDDDYYGPRYLSAMVGALRAGAASLVKLSTFACVDARTNALSLYEPLRDAGGGSPGTAPAAVSDAARLSYFWGYGWSYVYLRSLALASPFDDARHCGEDYAFVAAAAAKGRVVRALRDAGDDPVACRAVHAASSSVTELGRPLPRAPAWLRGVLREIDADDSTDDDETPAEALARAEAAVAAADAAGAALDAGDAAAWVARVLDDAEDDAAAAAPSLAAPAFARAAEATAVAADAALRRYARCASAPPDARDLVVVGARLAKAEGRYADAFRLFGSGRDERATFPTSLSAVSHSFRLISGRAIIPRSVLVAWLLFRERARADAR